MPFKKYHEKMLFIKLISDGHTRRIAENLSHKNHGHVKYFTKWKLFVLVLLTYLFLKTAQKLKYRVTVTLHIG